MKGARADLRDQEQRRRAAETLRLAADAIERGDGEHFEIRLEPHHDELYAARFVALKPTGAHRVTLHVAFVADPNTAKALEE